MLRRIVFVGWYDAIWSPLLRFLYRRVGFHAETWSVTNCAVNSIAVYCACPFNIFIRLVGFELNTFLFLITFQEPRYTNKTFDKLCNIFKRFSSRSRFRNMFFVILFSGYFWYSVFLCFFKGNLFSGSQMERDFTTILLKQSRVSPGLMFAV